MTSKQVDLRRTPGSIKPCLHASTVLDTSTTQIVNDEYSEMVVTIVSEGKDTLDSSDSSSSGDTLGLMRTLVTAVSIVTSDVESIGVSGGGAPGVVSSCRGAAGVGDSLEDEGEDTRLTSHCLTSTNKLS